MRTYAYVRWRMLMRADVWCSGAVELNRLVHDGHALPCQVPTLLALLVQSTNTDALSARLSARGSSSPHFTCFTETKVQILTLRAVAGTQFTFFTGTKVQILTGKEVAARKTVSPAISLRQRRSASSRS